MSRIMENRILGRCRLVRKIGEGGMGVVWLARHEMLQKDVAVKVLPESFSANGEAVQRFLREARSAARLEHPNVVQVLDAGSADGVHFIVMQYVDGTDLDKIVQKRGRLSVADSLAVAKRVALALAAAHKLGLIHRDIKPSNILITKQGRVRVTDFGLAREVGAGGSVTATDQIVGTPHYLSPEQARGDALDGRTDLYSLGGTLYTMLTGRPPYQGPTPISIAMKHASAKDRPEPIRSLAPDVPEEVEALAGRLMAKDPKDRFQTGDEAASAIDRVKSGGKATMVTVAEDKVLTPERRRRLLMAGAGAGLAAIFLLVFLLILLSPSKAERAYRAAHASATDVEKIVRLKDVATSHPGTEWARKASSDAAAIRMAMLQRDLQEVHALARDGKTSFRDVMTRLDLLRKKFPEEAGAVDRFEDGLHKARIVERTKRFAEVVKNHRPGEGDRDAERIKELIQPEGLRKIGEGGMRFWINVMLGIFSGFGGRLEEAEIFGEQMTFEARKTAVVPARVTVQNRKTLERTVQKVAIHWVWQEGDWYLSEKAIQAEEK
jgi:predicted Ser/Thr protein kinase